MAIDKKTLEMLTRAVRSKSSTAQLEVTELADACLFDLQLSGVYADDMNDPLVKQAIKLYCKANYGYDDKTEKFRDAYNALKNSMALSGDYDE